MTEKEALKLLRDGEDGIREWNLRREKGEAFPDLSGANFSFADLSKANLDELILTGANFYQVALFGSTLFRANLSRANLESVDFRRADLTDAVLTDARLNRVDLSKADLDDSDFTNAIISETTFRATALRDTKLGASWQAAVFAEIDFRQPLDLPLATFDGPCHVSVDTLEKSQGQIPDSFLKGCGFQDWQILEAKQYAPDLDAERITQIHYDIINARTRGPLFIGGVFISYSRDDAKCVDKIDKHLKAEGAPTWLDRHDMVAGDVQKQIGRAIRLNDVVLLVLSESSVNSDWVEHELEMARKKEKDERRDVLCPVALDDSWKAKSNDVLWRQVKKKNVLNFSKWKTKAFEGQFQKLLNGLKVNYPKRSESASATGAT